jgi:hypothetical protein
MSALVRHTRVAAGVLLVAACALFALAASAQDPRAGAAQSAARAWLELVDKGDPDASWNASGAKFKEAYPLGKWREALVLYRKPMGTFDSRTAVATTFNKDVPDLPPGEYANVQFRTNFSNKVDAHESISLERGADGSWTVIGYALN